ncbi:thioesterase domain-containing protein [Actinophytocola oryzae]|uniref:Surfactin synthase thioesterase subunit n=1 Tax=Actinophytocola oryzae TaxID=502181 RepID=A0A4R7V1I0_9PSEU|nr:thioesterase domain-containing protein [Actinophytocola oryzae]TDV43153.1 surfactin synthase thioesterase subunit [Actinophytocola oryzae]
MNWFVVSRPRPAAAVRLFCLPYAGGGASVFRGWPDAFGPDVELLAVAPPGRESRIGEDPRLDVTELAEAVAAEADRPYALYGHSLGGRHAFEVVRHLHRTGRGLPLRLYVGGCRAPHVRASGPFDGLSTLADDELLRRLADGGGLAEEILAEPELVELLLPVLRADFRALDEYEFVAGDPLPVPVVAFAGRADTAVPLADVRAWDQHAGAGLTVVEVDGGHFFLTDPASRLTERLAADLRAALPARPSAHRVPLGDTGWSVWRDALLRSAGFPADGLTALSSPAAAASADALLGGRDNTFEADFAAAVLANAERIGAAAANPLMREAVTWQNTTALYAFEGLAAGAPGAPRNVRRRDRERAVVKYWQRYSGKNETIGFFGPSCWVRIDDEQAAAARITPGPGLTRRRWVVFEAWALHAYADAIGADLAVRRWWPPMLAAHLTREGRQVHSPGRPPVTLSSAEAALLSACDGKQPAAAVVADPAAGLRREDDGYTMLTHLAERGLVTWDAGLPNTSAAEAVLRRSIAAIGDDTARARAVEGLDRLCAARDAVADSAGDADALRVALAGLDEVFTTLTGAAPHRRAGQVYAGRTLCYEDTARDLDVTFGRPLLDAVAAPLDLLLRAARWLSDELATAYTAAFRDLYAELREDAGDAPVRLSELWYVAQGLFWGAEGERPVDVVGGEFARRWAELFDLADATGPVETTSAALADRVAAAFPDRVPAWSAARLHSPDLQLCADGPEALARGDFQVVLGELHTAWASFDCDVFTPAHPDPDRLRSALADDLGTGRVRPLFPIDWPRRTSRVAESLAGPTDVRLAFADAPGAGLDRTLATTALVVSEVDGELVAVDPAGRRWPLVEVFSQLVAIHAVDAFKLTSPARHTPRITVDRLVVGRETWRTTADATGLTRAKGERDRYLAVRRLRLALGLPDAVFVKLGTETKPFYADLTSPAYASLLCAALRTAVVDGGPDVPVVLTELLPGPDQAWVPDAAGHRYVSELRLHIVDATGDRS